MPSDPTQFLQTLKGVSEKVKVDESARAMKRLSSGEVKGLGSKSTGTRIRKEKENLRRSTTGVKESDKRKSPVVGSRSLPIMGGGDMEADGHMEVDESATFQIDVDMDRAAGPSHRQSPYDKHAIVPTSAPGPQPRPNFSSHMPPPPVPVPKVQPLPPLPPPRDHPKSTVRLISNPIPSPIPKSTSPQRAPPPPKDTHPQASPSPSPHHSQRPSSLRPPNSQLTSRPPALGMRRSLTTSSLAPSQTLPEKQRGFKVPLAKPAPPIFSTQLPTSSYPRKNIQVSRVLPTPEPSPPNPAKETSTKDGGEVGTQHNSSSPAPDADSSYGDMSFDMDALEETMKKYD
ncbi:hypothetical protein PILCRDRAFT_309435 [Piloderma croceum F 1598]|uniref:Uncharacterized protein n=1 Tax=Piloderma croceum (strain F 1598) TaxID=765440 RepID=A0A0C3G493_PILCF|nr:hypothetical protein PILCRDRAFT_309435 [Piloderma croceum F 1598]